MGQTNQIRFPKWLWLTLAIVDGLGAAFALTAYVGNGMVAGDLIGLPGREHDISVEQHRASIGLLSCVLLQFGVAGALFSYTDRENGCWAFLRCLLGSLALSVLCGFAILLGLKAFR
jgi:hypothetical protein